MDFFDVIIIGTGPGGYTAAALCAKNGLSTAVVERDNIGGVCLNVGCIPTKALIHCAEKIHDVISDNVVGLSIDYQKNIDLDAINNYTKNVSRQMSKGIEYIFKKQNVTVIRGAAKFVDNYTLLIANSNNEQYTIYGKYIIIATGSRNRDIGDALKNSSSGKIMDSTAALELKEIPQKMAVIGGGAIGCEFSYIYKLFGADVTLFEYFPTLLPANDKECGKTLERSFKKMKIDILTGAQIETIKETENGCKITYKHKNNLSENEYSNVLIAAGRIPNSDNIDIDNAGVGVNEKGYIKTDKYMQTNINNIYAVGDVAAGAPLLAHAAYEQARIAVENILGNPTETQDNKYIPSCIYTYPQVGSFGLTEDDAKEGNISFKVIKTFFKTSGKAAAIDKTDGFIKVIIDTESDTILGASIVGADATELIHELLVVSKNNIKLTDFVNTVHAHPTLSESVWECIKSYQGLSLH